MTLTEFLKEIFGKREKVVINNRTNIVINPKDLIKRLAEKNKENLK